MILKNPSHTADQAAGSSFPTPAITDSFTRADSGSLGANYGRWWNGDVDLTVVSNRAGGSTTNYYDNYYNVAQYQNCDIAVTVAVLPSTGDSTYIGGRIQSAGLAGMDCYQLLYTNAATDTITLQRVINSTETTLQTWNQNLSAGNSYGMRISGTGSTVTIEVYVNTGSGWTLLGTYSDTNANRITATGYGGLGVINGTARLDDFIVGNS